MPFSCDLPENGLCHVKKPVGDWYNIKQSLGHDLDSFL